MPGSTLDDSLNALVDSTEPLAGEQARPSYQMPKAKPEPAPGQAIDQSLETFLNQDQTDQLRGTVELGAKKPQASALKTLQLTGKTGLPADFVDRNQAYVEEQASKQDFNPQQLMKDSPAFASWLSESPDHVAVAKPDVQALSFIEKQLMNIPAQYEQGKRTVEYGDVMLGVVKGLLDGTDVAALRKRQAELEAEMAVPDESGLAAAPGVAGVLQRAPGWMAQQLPILGSTLAEQVKAGATGVAGGALLGGATGGLPGAAVGGVAVGAAMWRIGAATNSARMEFAQAFGDYEKLKDAEGLPLDQQTAMGLAGIVGVVNGAIDGFFGIEGLTSKLPGINQFTRQGVKEMLKSPTASRAILSYAKTVGQVMATEGVTEALQMYITKTGGVALQAVKDGGSPADWLSKIFSPENFEQAKTEAEAGAFGGGGIATVLATPQLAADAAKVREANKTKRAFESIGEATGNTKFHVELPAQLRDIIDRATKDGPIETLYVPEHAFREYFQKEGVDPRAVYREITGDVAAYDQAVETGADLSIKTADYVQKLAGTKHNKFFANEIRTSPDAMNGWEAEQWVKEQDAAEKASAEQGGVLAANANDPAAQVRTQIAGQLTALGFPANVVDQYAALFESRYKARAERRGLGETAADLFNKQNLNISRPVPEVLQRMGNTTELDALLEQLRSGEGPQQSDLYGQSLTEFLKEKGGVQDIGGELKARNVDQNRKPFKRNLIQKAGKGLDEAATAAFEAGYIPEANINALLDAIDQEVRDKPVYAVSQENTRALDLQQNLASLKQYLDQRGIDLATTPNAQIKQMLGEAVQPTLPGVEGQTFAQLALPGPPTTPTFFSKLEQVVLEKMNPTMPAADLRKMLVANGVKEEELKWTGLDDYLKEHPTVTKPEVAKFLMTHLVTITPVILGETPQMTEEQFYQQYAEPIARLRDMGWETTVLFEDGENRVGFMEINPESEEEDPGDIVTWDDLPNKQPGQQPGRLTDAKIKEALGQQFIIRLTNEGMPVDADRDLMTEFVGTDDALHGTGMTRVYGFTLPNNAGSSYLMKARDGGFVIPIAGSEMEAPTLEQARRILYEEFVAPEILDVRNTNFMHGETPRGIARMLNDSVENPPSPAGSSATKFASYQMKPGEGQHYREVLLTLPERERSFALDEYLEKLNKKYGQDEPSPNYFVPAWSTQTITPEERATLASLQVEARHARSDDQFLAGHYQVPNVLAHVRMNDRTDSEGRRVLFIEEIQSDWHQKARDVRKQEINRLASEQDIKKGTAAFKELEATVPADFGYRKKWKPEEVAKFKVLSPPLAQTGGNEFGSLTSVPGGYAQGDWVVIDGDGNVLATPPRSHNKTAQDALDLIKKSALAGTLHGMGKFPAAPFQKTEQWTALAVKWLLRYAAEGGYDVMAWTPGAVQNDRYSLSQQIEQIRYEKNEDGSYHLWIKPIGSSEVDQIRNTDFSAVPIAQLPDIVGKDVAEKIVDGFTSAKPPIAIPDLEEIESGTGGKIVVGASEAQIHGFDASINAMIRWSDGSHTGYESADAAHAALLEEYYKDNPHLPRPEKPTKNVWSGLVHTTRVAGVDVAAYDTNRHMLWFDREVGRVYAAPLLHTGEVDFDHVEPVGRMDPEPLPTDELLKVEDALRMFTIGGPTRTLKVNLPLPAEALAPKPHVISGLDLNVAGGGMKSFYDKLLPNVLKDVGKKWGAKVETVKLAGPSAPFKNVTALGFRDIAEEADGFQGASDWPNGDVPQIADSQVRINDKDFDVQVVVSPEGVTIAGMTQNDEPFEYGVSSDIFSPSVWTTATNAKNVTEGFWPHPDSQLWQQMTLRHGDPLFATGADANVIARIGPTPERRNPVDVQGVPITAPMKEAVTVRGFPLFQSSDKPKGSITFGNQQISIKLLESADLSTFIHESGHLYLNELLQDVEAVSAVPVEQRTPVQTQLLEDAETLFTWLGKSAGEAITVAQHEQFARGFEAYAMEGKSPSQAMREIFATFRQWLIQAYRSLTTAPLNVKLTNPVRDVMGRMIATDQEIDAAADQAEVHPMFTDAESAGMTPAEFKAYQDTVARASLTARETLQKQLMAQYQRQHEQWWKARREEVEAQVTDEVNDQNEYVALAVLQTGKLPDGSDLPPDVQPMKLDKKAVASQSGEAMLRRLPKGTTKFKGMHPDTAAPLFGYPSGEALVLGLVNARPKKELIQAETDKRMAEQYGDMLIDGSIHDAARAAVVNDEQAQVIAAEIRALNKKRIEVSPFVKAATGAITAAEKVGRDLLRTMIPTLQATRELARKILARTPLKQVNPNQYMITARQSSKQATAELAKKNYVDAGHFKQRELMNLALYREAMIFQQQVQQVRDLATDFGKADSTLAKTRNVDLVNVGRAILAQYGLARPVEKTAADYLAPIKTYDQDLYDQWKPQVDALAPRPLDYRALTVEEFAQLHDNLQALWLLSRRTKQIMVDGQLKDRADIIDELSAVMAGWTKQQQAQVVGAQTQYEETKMGLLSWGSALKRVESWVHMMDGGNIAGPFRRILWTPISEASDRFREAKKNLLQQYLELIKPIEQTLTRDLIAAPELGPHVSFMGKTALLHAVLHTGNDSNQTKLLKGYNWAPSQWQAFLDRMYRERVLTKLDYDFAQGVWDLLESIKPQAQKAHHEMYGYYFNEITARPVATPFGTYKGGYIPAIADRAKSVDQAIREEKDLFDQAGNSFMFPTTGRGFTKSRVEQYTAPLALDMTSIPVHFDKTMRFVHLEPRVKDAARLVTNKKFRQALDAMNSTVAKDMLVPWLQRSAQQTVSTPGKNRHADALWRYLRKAVGAQIMVVNVVNTLQQFSGFPIAATMVKPRYLRGAMMNYLRHPINYGEDIAARSAFMRGRTATQVIEIQQTIDDILLNPTKYDQVRKFLERHGYFMQQGTQNLVDLVTWGGAYDQALAKDLDERMAVRAADSAVRLTQGTFAPEDMSAFEAGTPFTRAFTMFYSYFNMQANLLTTEMQIVAHEMGLKKGAGRAFYVYLFGFAIPAILSEAIIKGLGGFDPDDDDDYLNEALSIFFGSQLRTALAMIPGIGPITLSGIGAFTSKQYDDRISTSPIVTVLESAVRAPHSLYQAMSEEGHSKRAIRDVLTLVGLVTGMPAGALARPLGYMGDWYDGVAQPETVGDVARGLVSGKDVNRTK